MKHACRGRCDKQVSDSADVLDIAAGVSRSFCADGFIQLHSSEYHPAYMQGKRDSSCAFFMLVSDALAAVVTANGCLLEYLYVLPAKQRQGYGTELYDTHSLDALERW